MTRKQLAERVEHWRAQLVPEWRITIGAGDITEDERENARACIKPADAYHHADLWLAPETLRSAPGELDVTIVHELLHLLTRGYRRTLDLADGQLHRDVASLLENHLELIEEELVERLARVIAKREHPDGIVYGTT